jgi:hypothetical protein
LLLFCDLKSFHEVSVFHIKLLEQQIGFGVLFKLERRASHTLL